MNRILAWLAGILAVLAGFFRLRQMSAEAKIDRLNAQIAKADADAGRKADAAIADVQAKHRKEQQDSEGRFKAGKRDHLEGYW